MNDLWLSWIGTEEPADWLRSADQAVAAGKAASRREFFRDHARTAWRNRQPDVPDNCTPEAIGDELFELAESTDYAGL